MTFNLAQTIQNDSPTKTPVGALERAIEMGNLMAAADQEVQRLADELNDARKRYNSIAMDRLPQLLGELGLASIELANGAKIEVKGDVAASITAAHHELAMKWLVDNNFGGIIKTNVTVSFPADEQEDAAEFAARVSQEHDGVTYKAAVHPQTLKSFVKEQLAAGNPFPLDLFSVHEYSIAKLTQPRS